MLRRENFPGRSVPHEQKRECQSMICPPPYENIIHIFFTCKSYEYFSLVPWRMRIQTISSINMRSSIPQKILWYDKKIDMTKKLSSLILKTKFWHEKNLFKNIFWPPCKKVPYALLWGGGWMFSQTVHFGSALAPPPLLWCPWHVPVLFHWPSIPEIFSRYLMCLETFKILDENRQTYELHPAPCEAFKFRA